MKIQKSFKIRIYPTKVKEALLAMTFGCKRFIRNQMLAERLAFYHEYGKGIGKLRRTEKEWKEIYPFLKDVDSIALQQARIDLDTAYTNFFAGRARFPRFKSRKSPQSYRTECVSGNIRIDAPHRRIRLPKIGWISYRDDRTITGTIVNATVSKTKSGRYFASVLVSQEMEIEQEATLYEESIAAFDMSANDFLVGDTLRYENPRFYRNNETKLARLGRRVSRKVKGSANRDKARVRLARFYDRIGNQRTNWLQKISTDLADRHDAIVIEDLNIDGMKRWNGGLAKSVTLDFSWGSFAWMLEYKMAWQALDKGRSLLPVEQDMLSMRVREPGVDA
jgi:putative transposase